MMTMQPTTEDLPPEVLIHPSTRALTLYRNDFVARSFRHDECGDSGHMAPMGPLWPQRGRTVSISDSMYQFGSTAGAMVINALLSEL